MYVDPHNQKLTQLPRKKDYPQAHIAPADTIIVESGARGIYFSATAPVYKLNKAAPKIRVGTASGVFVLTSLINLWGYHEDQNSCSLRVARLLLTIDTYVLNCQRNCQCNCVCACYIIAA